MSKSRDLGEFPAAALDIDASGNLDVTGTVTADGLVVDGNVGIGTISPTALLDVSNASNPSVKVRSNGGTAGNYAELTLQSFNNFSGSGQGFIRGLSSASGNSNTDLVFGTNSAGFGAPQERMRIDSSGNVGIGISAPLAPLAVKGTTDGNLWVRGASAAAVGLTGVGLSSVNDAASAIANMALEANNFHFVTNNSEKVRIDSAGKVSVGTKAWISADANVGYFGGNAAQTNHISFYDALNLIRIYTSGSERMRIDSAGHFLVGTTISLGQTCTVRGNTNTTTEGTIYLANDGGSAVYASFGDTAGTITGYIQKIGSGVNYASVSDKRLKENITDSNDAGSKIDAIQVRQYDWKADGSHQDYGMIAQELISVVPDAVSGSENTDDMMGVDFSKLVPMLVKEVQSLRARVAALESI